MHECWIVEMEVTEGYDLEWDDMVIEIKPTEKATEEIKIEYMDTDPELDEEDDYEYVMMNKKYYLYSEKTGLVFDMKRVHAGWVNFFGEFVFSF